MFASCIKCYLHFWMNRRDKFFSVRSWDGSPWFSLKKDNPESSVYSKMQLLTIKLFVLKSFGLLHP